ncbi:MAG: type II secretion system protein [Patescibacteria group bacterium]|nr:type II secretion system GspH family protein [Patescibacteria group bacterium]
MKKFVRENGFTLLELVVAMAIFGGLILALYAAIGAARRSARDTAKKADLQAIELLVEDYYGSEVRYPVISRFIAIDTDTVCIGDTNTNCNYGVKMDLSSDLGASTHLQKTTGDPAPPPGGVCDCSTMDHTLAATRESWWIGYRVSSDGQIYCMYTRLENKQCFTVMPQH